jgi:integrase
MAIVRKRTWTTRAGKEKTRWLVDYRDQAGKRRFQTYDRKKDAEAALVDVQGEIKQGIHTPASASITVAEAAQLWIEKSELDALERSTLRQRRTHVDLHIVPLIGGVKLARLSAPMVGAFRDDLLRKGSRAMARKILTSLKGIIGEAQGCGLIAQNVAQPVQVDVKKREKGGLAVGVDIPSKEEVQKILAAAIGRWRPFFATSVFTGMRASELRGLTWDAVDLDKRVVHVRQRANLWGEIGAPKSAAGWREIPIAPMVVNALREWRLACPRGDHHLVFPNGNGNVESHANIANRGWYPLQIAAGLVGNDGKPKYGLHALRHFFASWVIERGFSAKRVQALLGHSSIQMTFDVYGHLFPSLEDDHAKFAAGEQSILSFAAAAPFAPSQA